jgi:hypothetical protein
MTTSTRRCHDCGALPGELHRGDCDVERCPACGGQYATCDCPRQRRSRRIPWSGRWPGEAECAEFGWYAKLVPGVGWVRCGPDEPGAEPDLNRLQKEARWDHRAGRFVRRDEG